MIDRSAPSPHPEQEALAFVDGFVRQTRTAVFVRRADGLLLIRPDKTMGLNQTATEILAALYAKEAPPAAQVLPALASKLNVGVERITADTVALVGSVRALLNEDYAPREGLRFGAFDRSSIGFPTIAEIALTYRCNNRCSFCYAASPFREEPGSVMSTEQVKTVMDKIFHEAHVPSLSFTGGEATLRDDLPELISYGKQLGFRINLISNGLCASDESFAKVLVDAGLDSAQISLEAADPALHDKIVGKVGAHARTVAAVGNLQRLGIHVHTNSTLCADNLDHAAELVRYAAGELELRTMSMNMLIRTGSALSEPGMEISYEEVGARLPGLVEVAEAAGIRLVWYSPIPYCIFNPVLAGLGAKSCACVDGLLSVDPTGQLLPCSSFGDGIGSLLDHGYEELRTSSQARYWREKRYVPPVCGKCPEVDICGGACPLYWDEAGSFGELPRAGASNPAERHRWEQERPRGGSFGVPEPGGLVQLRSKE